MNYTALKASFSSDSFLCRLYAAIVAVARYRHSVAHIVNRHNHAIIAVRYNRHTGFEFTDKNGCDITNTMLSLMKTA